MGLTMTIIAITPGPTFADNLDSNSLGFEEIKNEARACNVQDSTEEAGN
jgi:hypothetical protein